MWWLISSSGRGSRYISGTEFGFGSLGELICQIVNCIHNSVKGLHLNLTIVFILVDVKGAIIPVEKDGWSLESIAPPNDIIQSFVRWLIGMNQKRCHDIGQQAQSLESASFFK
jgi:hypothetical protein